MSSSFASGESLSADAGSGSESYEEDVNSQVSYDSGSEEDDEYADDDYDPREELYNEDDDIDIMSFKKQKVLSLESSEEDKPSARPRKMMGSPRPEERRVHKPEPKKAEQPTRRIPTSPSSSKTFKPVVRERVKVAPIVYQYPGDPQDTTSILEGIEATLEDIYPNEENNETVARCVLFHLMYKSYYPTEIQTKVGKVVRLLSSEQSK